MQITAKKKKKGFTLIELLVVIAIIGILASIVLVSLSGAKKRAADARIISDLNQTRSSAEILNSGASSYAGVLTDTDIDTLMADMNSMGATNILRTGNSTEYCVEAKMPGSGLWGCVNSGLTATFNLANDPACAGNANGASSNTMCQ